MEAKKFVIDLEHSDQILVMKIGVMASIVMEQGGRQAPLKFKLAERAAANMLICQPITLEQFNGFADAIGGFFAAVELGSAKDICSRAEQEEAHDFMRLVDRIRKQVKTLELVKSEDGSELQKTPSPKNLEEE